MINETPSPLEQGSPNSRPVRNQAPQQEVSLNVKPLNHPETAPLPHRPPLPGPWKNCLPQNPSLVPKRLGTDALEHLAGHHISADSGGESLSSFKGLACTLRRAGLGKGEPHQKPIECYLPISGRSRLWDKAPNKNSLFGR